MTVDRIFLVGIVTFFVLIFISLGVGLFNIVRGKKEGFSVVKSLTWRIGLSLLLFCLLLIAFAKGWLHPHALGG